MRRTTNLFRMVSLGVVVAMVSVLAPAQSVFAQSRIATIEINSVLDKLSEKAVQEQNLQGTLTELENRVNAAAQAVEEKQKELDIIPRDDPEYGIAAEDYIRKGLLYKMEREMAQALAEKKRKEIQLALFKKIVEATGRYAKREGIGIVVANDSKEEIPDIADAQQVQGAILGRKVIWADDSLDISSAVASMMNNEYTAGS